MTNADKFKEIFGIYATELWAKPEKEFLEWLNADVPDTNVGDMISRRLAIDEMQEYWRSLNLRRKSIPLAAEAVYMDLKGVVATLPSAEPERKKGRWIKHEDRTCWYCSECNEDNYYAYVWDGDTGEYVFQDHYCPNCGAEMVKGEADGHN